MKILRRALLAVLMLAPVALHAQATIPVSGQKVVNNSRLPLTGQLVFTVTDITDTPITYTPQGGSPTTATFTIPVVNGAVQNIGGFPPTITNSLTMSPANTRYRIQTQSTGGGITYFTFPLTNITTSSFSYDGYIVAAGITVSGAGIPTLNCNPSAMYNNTLASDPYPWVCSKLQGDAAVYWTQNPSLNPSCARGNDQAIASSINGTTFCIDASQAYVTPGFVWAGPVPGNNPTQIGLVPLSTLCAGGDCGSGGVTKIIPGTNVTCTPSVGGNCTGIVTINSSGGGGVLPGAQSQIAGYSQPSTTSIVGPGSQTLNYVTPILQGERNTDQFISGGGNNGISNALASCATTGCFLFTPPYSADLENITPLSQSSYWQSMQYGSMNLLVRNPAVNPFLQEQLGSFQGINFNAINPPGQGQPQGVAQNWIHGVHNFDTAGWSNGITGCPLFCPQTGYTTGAQWTVAKGESDTYFFRGAGIHNDQDRVTNCYGVGDCQGGFGAAFTVVEGGAQAPSDEGTHEFGSGHADTFPDFVGTIATITSPTQLFATPIVAGGSQGQLRFLIDESRPLLHQQPMAIIYSPRDIAPYGVVVFNSSSPTLPVSNFIGTLAADCVVPVQTNGTATTTCTFNITSGAIDTTHLFCMAAPSAAEFAFGAQVLSASISGGIETATLKIRKSVPAGAYAFQGGGCGMVLDMNADVTGEGAIADGNAIHGSAFPIIGSIPDGTGTGITHSVAYINYQASQVWGSIPNAGSLAHSQAISGGAFQGVNGGSFVLVNVARTAGVVTGSISSGNQSEIPFSNVLNLTSNFSISGCSDSSVNGLQAGVHNGILSPTNQNVFIFNQSGADTTCVGGTVLVTLQGVNADLLWGVEVFDVVNHTPGTVPAAEADGTFATSYQTNFQVGDVLDMPPHYAVTSGGIFLARELYTPNSENQGITLDLQGNSGLAGAAIAINNAVTIELVGGLGGVQTPIDILDATGEFRAGLNMFTAPIAGGCVICVGFPAGSYADTGAIWGGRYKLFDIENGNNQLAWDDSAHTFTFVANQISAMSISPAGTVQNGINVIHNAQFEGFNPSLNGPVPVTQIREGAVRNGFEYPVYDSINNIPPTVTNSGTPGSTQYAYWIAINTPYGVSWTPLTFTFTGNATLSGSNFNQISCSVVPAGETGTVYTFRNPNFFLVGSTPNQCTSSSVTVNDTGAAYAGPFGSDVLSMGGGFYSGSFVANGNKGAFAFTQSDNFNDVGSPLAVDTWLTHPASHTWSFDNTKGDGAAAIIAGSATIAGSAVCTVATGCSAGTGITLTTTGTGGAATLTGTVLNIPVYTGGGGSGVPSINGTAGAFTFTGSGVSCATTTCTFSGGGPVSSVFGRTGAVVAATNDYSFSQISGNLGTGQGPSSLSGLLKDTAGTLSVAAAGTDYLTPTGSATGLSKASASAFGVSECDGTTITCSGGIFTAVGGGNPSVGAHFAVQMAGATAGTFADTGCTSDGSGHQTCASQTLTGTTQGLDAYGVGTGTISATLPTNYVGIIGPASGTPAYFLQLPSANPTAGQVIAFAAPTTINGVSQAVGTWVTPGGTGTVTGVTGTLPIVSSGGTAPAISCPTCVTSAAALTNNAVMIGGGSQASSTISADTTTTHFLAATAGAPGFRAIVSGDIPTLNQSTTGSAGSLSATLSPTTGGTGLSSPTAHSFMVAEGASNMTLVTSPAVNGYYNCGFTVVASAAVDPACSLAGVPVNAQSGAYTLLYSDRMSYIKESGGSTATLTLPQVTGNTAANMAFVTQNLNSGTETLTANAADKIDGSATGGSSTVPSNYAAFAYQESSSAPGNWWTLKVPTLNLFASLATGAVKVTTATGALSSISTNRSLGWSFGDVATGSTLTTSAVGYITVPFACTVVGWHVMADAGTVTIKTARVNGGTALPTIASNSISTSGVSLASGTKVDSTTVTDFTSTAIAANDTLGFFITTVATAKQITFSIDCAQ